MSQENVDAARRCYEAWNSDDLDAFLDLCDPGIEWHTALEQAFEGEGVTYSGHDGIRKAWEDYRGEAFGRITPQAHQLRDLGESVLVLGRLTTAGRSSGIELDHELGQILTFRRGKIIRSQDFLSQAEALDAAASRSKPMSQASIELVRVLFEAWNAGDMDAFGEGYDRDAIMRAVEGWPEPGPWVGREAIMRQWEQMREAWDADEVEAVGDIIQIGDRVAVRYIWHGSGHGPESKLEFTTVCTVRKGKIVYQEFFWDHAEGLEALGLAERDAHAESG